MQPHNMRFGGGPSETVLNPLVAGFVVLAVVLFLFLRRRHVIAPLLAASILIPMDQVLVIGSLHFQMIRLLILFAGARMLASSRSLKLPIFSGGVNAIDKVVILAAIFTAIDGFLLLGSSGIAIQLGTLFTTVGMYVLVRFFIRDEKDVDITIASFAYIAAVVAVVMAIERTTGHNPYSILGGFRAVQTETLMARDDHFRAMACFSHPILAGTFGATLFPLFVGLWFRGKQHRVAAVVGIIAATVITGAANSSTPLVAYVAVIGCIFLWPLRDKMQIIRRAIVVLLVSLQLAMKAPVWALIARMDVINGSSGYHRYQLVDQFIRHFGDWCLVGTIHNAEWGWDMWDIANQYVGIGESSGLVPLVLFIATITYGFKFVGRARRRANQSTRQKWFLWMLGVAMLAHVVAFIGISYFDQTQVLWYAFLAIISTSAIKLRVLVKRTAPALDLAPMVHEVSGLCVAKSH